VVFLNTPTYIADYILYLKGKYKSLIIWGAVTFGLQVVLLCLPLLMGQTLNLAINLWVILSLLKFNYTIILLMKYSIISVHTRLILDFMKRVMPFMFSILLAGSMEYISSYIVQHYYTEAEFVIFRYGAKELPVFLILANSLSNVFSGEVAKLNQEGKLEEGLRKLKHASTKLMRRTFPATMILMFVSPWLFRYMYSEQFVEGYKVFNIYLLLIISRMIFPQTVIMGIMKNRIFYVISFNYIIINVLLSFWFMYLFGIYGIAYATAIAFLAEKIMYAIYCKMEGIRFREYTALYEHLVFSILTVIVYFASMWLWNTYPLVS
jgi:O-antigen/teichoic acid export membrane protein